MTHHMTSSGKSLISSEKVEGTTVYGMDGKKIGNVGELMIDRVSGRVVYAVVDFGGFLGMSESHHPLPWSSLDYDTTLDGYKTNVTKDQLKNAPDYDDDSFGNREWETRTHTNYKAQPYWSNPSLNR